MRHTIFAAAFFSAVPMTADATEEPPHVTLIKEGPFEIREYEPTIVAEVEITGDMREPVIPGSAPSRISFSATIPRARRLI